MIIEGLDFTKEPELTRDCGDFPGRCGRAPKSAQMEVPNGVSLEHELDDYKNHARISPVTQMHVILAIFPNFKYLPLVSVFQNSSKKNGHHSG